MVKVKIIPYLFFTLALLISCQTKKENIIEYQEVTNFDRLDNNVIFGRIFNIKYSAQKYFLLDEKSVFVLDESFDLLSNWSRLGQGPKEYKNVRSFEVSNNQIHLVDNGSKSIKTYTFDGVFLSNRRFEQVDIPYHVQNFIVTEAGYYLAGNHLIELNIAGDINPILKLSENHFLSLFKTENNFLMINHGSGLIDLYDSSFDKKSSFNIRKLEAVQTLLFNVDPTRPGQFLFIWDVDLVGDELYLLIAGYNEEGLRVCNTILKHNISNLENDAHSLIRLPSRRYSSFAVNPTNLNILAHDEVSGSVVEYTSQ